MSDLTENYGRECQTSGSCVHLINDLIIFTGNDGKLRVARLEDSDSPLFSRLPGPAVTICDPALSSSSRILSLHPRVCSDGSVTVLARYRQGAALFSVQETEGEREGPGWVKSVPPSLPVSAGLASVCWTPGSNTRQVVTVSSEGELAVWDQARGGRTAHHSLPGGQLQHSWAASGPGFHPASVVVTDRLRCDILDARSGSWTRLGLPTVGQTNQVRQVDCESTAPHCYLLTDHHLLLYDLRVPRAPVLSQLTGLGRHTRSPSWLWGRTRLDSQDWMVAGSAWADLRLTVLDWSHSHCHTATQAEDLWINCQAGEGEGPPRVLGGVESLGTWRDSVVRARALGGQWLHPALEQRAALPFTGLAVSSEPGPGNNINILAVNAIGDLFGKVLYLEEEEEEDIGHDDVESEENKSHEVERWLTDWADAVVSKSFLPQVTLSNRFPRGQNKWQKELRPGRGFIHKLRLPVFVQSKSWKKRFRGSKKVKRVSKQNTKSSAMDKPTFLPCITDAEWPENLTQVRKSGKKMLNIEAVKEEMVRERVNNSFGSNGFQISKPKIVNPRRKEISPLSLVINAKLEKEEELKDEIHLHHIQQFKQLNLEDFYNREDNINSSRILKVMMGEMDDTTASRRMSTVSHSSGVPSPALPTEEDTSFPLASFWEDLGVDMPSVSQSQEVDQGKEDEEEFEL